MSLNLEELKKHCKKILSDRKIKNKVVVLCEGEIKNVEGSRSPKAYKSMEKMPDANFYTKCVSTSWRDKPKPQFFNCGDRKDVIDSYFYLLKSCDKNMSYLTKAKLFALIDLDIQKQNIDNYDFSDTEQIFGNLYQETKIVKEKANKHRIWITGLIHKEAYFITPDTQEIFAHSILEPQYKNNSVSLKDIYLEICNEINEDKELQTNFDRVRNRINYCEKIDCCSIDKLKDTWNKEFIKLSSSDNQRKRKLVFILLTIRKAKKYWNQIEPNSDWSRDHRIFREQLSLEIGDFYSKQDWNNPENHIAYFFKTLYQFA